MTYGYPICSVYTKLQDNQSESRDYQHIGNQLRVCVNSQGTRFALCRRRHIGSVQSVEANFQKAADLDLDIYITELDVSLSDGATLEQQANVYRRVLDICLRQPRCKGLQTWGFTDQYSWRREFKPLLLDEAYQPKPAYRALQERLSEN